MNEKRYNKPFEIDMPFNEALERFSRTKPEDIDSGESGIKEDEFGNICLTDLFALAERPKNRKPNDWYRSARAKRLQSALIERTTGDSRRSFNLAEKSTYYKTGKGRGTRVFAHPVLALDYAEFVNPELGLAVRDTFLRYKRRDVSLALEILEGLSEQDENDALRVKLRALVAEHNKLSAGAAKGIGVTNFAAYNGSGLLGLYGMQQAKLLEKKGLPEGANHLDYAGHEELAANYFKATQAVAKLKRDADAGIKGQAHANMVHKEIGEGVRKQIRDWGGKMPEDEPAVEHIKEPKKRINAKLRDENKSSPKEISKK